MLSACSFGVLGVDAAVRLPFLISALASLLAVVATFALREAAAPTRAPLLPAVRALAHRGEVRLLWAGSIAYYVAHGVFDSYFGPYARTLPGVRTADVSAAWALGVFSEIATILLVPRWLESGARRYLLPGSALVAALRWALLARAESALALFLLAPLHGVTFGVWYLAFVHENQAGAPASIRATVQGVAQAAIAAGLLTASLFGGYAFERFGGRALFHFATVAALVAAALYAARERQVRRSALRLASAAPES